MKTEIKNKLIQIFINTYVFVFLIELITYMMVFLFEKINIDTFGFFEFVFKPVSWLLTKLSFIFGIELTYLFVIVLFCLGQYLLFQKIANQKYSFINLFLGVLWLLGMIILIGLLLFYFSVIYEN